MPASEDRISALPDGVLQHVLGFLPAHDAVRTSVLAGRWRHAWRSIRRLHLSPDDGWDGDSPEHLKDFLDALLCPGDHDSILEEAKLNFDGLVEDYAHAEVWIRQILLGQAQVLDVSFATLENPPLVSRHLRKLELTEMVLEGDVLDFASCPALEDLKMAYCRLYLDKISSRSVKRLSIDRCDFFCDCRPSISIPSLVWLLLDYCRVPFLESMPSLETAFVKPAAYSRDCCIRGTFKECCGTCAECTGDGDHGSRCVLGGLSSAIHLELVAEPGMRREFITVLEGNCYPLDKLRAISKHLNIVEIRCRDVDGRVCRILKLLR